MSDTGAKPQGFSVLGIGLIFLLGLVLVGVLFIGNLGAPPSKTPFGPVGAEAGPEGFFNQVANDFLLDLKGGRLDAAYAHTSAEFQQRLSLDQFRAMMKTHPFPGYPGSEGTSRREDAGQGVWVYDFRATGPRGQLHFSFDVGKEGEQYRVTRLAFD